MDRHRVLSAAKCFTLLVFLVFNACGKSDRTALPDRDLRPKQAKPAENLPVYSISLKLAGDLLSFTGTMDLAYFNTSPALLETLAFRLYPNVLGGALLADNVRIDGLPVSGENVIRDGKVPDYSVLELRMPQPLEPGGRTDISLDFRGSVSSGTKGYGFTQFSDGVLLLAYCYPLLAPRDENGWQLDPPAYPGDPVAGPPAWYRVEAEVPAGHAAAASGVQTSEKRQKESTILTFEAGPARDFFMAVSAGWDEYGLSSAGTDVRSFYPKAAEEAGKASAMSAVSALETLAGILGPYPYSEFDLVSGPTNALGVEYPGIVVISDDLYAGGASSSGIPNAVLLEATIVHEVAHQWFYNIVGNNQAREPWIDEGLAQYLTYAYYRKIRGPGAAEQYKASFEDRWERIGRKSIPLGLPVSAYADREYGSIIYGRAPLFFIELEQTMGEGRFGAFLEGLVSEYGWKTLDTAAFMKTAERYAEKDLTELFKDWIQA